MNKYWVAGNRIYVDPPMKKQKDGIKVYYYRGEQQSEEPSDYPVAIANTPKGNHVEWPHSEFKILGVSVKRKKWFGLLCTYWEGLERKEWT